MTVIAFNPTFGARLSAARPLLIRAGLLGLCGGLVIVGLLENTKRFAEPETLYTEARLAADLPENDLLSRTDRLDAQIAVTMATPPQIAR